MGQKERRTLKRWILLKYQVLDEFIINLERWGKHFNKNQLKSIMRESVKDGFIEAGISDKEANKLSFSFMNCYW